MPLWETDRNRSHDALSREISHRNAARTIRGGDFSTPLRCGRNDDRGARRHRHLEREYVPLWETDRNRSHDTLSREISHRNAARTIRGGDFSTPLRFGRKPSGPKTPSNLRTLRPRGRSILRTFPSEPSEPGPQSGSYSHHTLNPFIHFSNDI